MRSILLSTICVLGACLAPGARESLPGVGHDGGFPSEAGRRILETLYGTEWKDGLGVLGGGTWHIHGGGVTFHPLGPGSANVIRMMEGGGKGPHVVLVQGEEGVFFPMRSDGDVVGLLRFLGREVPDAIEGEPGPLFRKALSRIRQAGDVAPAEDRANGGSQ